MIHLVGHRHNEQCEYMLSTLDNPRSTRECALDQDHDTSILGNIAGMLGGGAGTGFLNMCSVASRSRWLRVLAERSAWTALKPRSFSPCLPQSCWGALGSAKRPKGLDAGGLATRLGEERTAIGAKSGGGGGSLLQLIDADKDGSVMDDVGGMLGRMFGR